MTCVVAQCDEGRVASQNGEDGVIATLLAELNVDAPTFVEIGAGDGTEGNCVVLAACGARGVFIEADPVRHGKLVGRWFGQPNVTSVCERVTAENINDVFYAVNAAAEPSVLSLDIDGNDYWVWDALWVARPLVVVVEFNGWLQGSVVQPYDPEWRWDGTEYFGASLDALRGLATRKGYKFVYAESTGANAFFVRDDVADVFAEGVAPIRVPKWRHRPDVLAREYVAV